MVNSLFEDFPALYLTKKVEYRMIPAKITNRAIRSKGRVLRFVVIFSSDMLLSPLASTEFQVSPETLPKDFGNSWYMVGL